MEQLDKIIDRYATDITNMWKAYEAGKVSKHVFARYMIIIVVDIGCKIMSKGTIVAD